GEQQVIFNPEIVESDGEWVYDEGCLSIPGLYVEMVRPKTVLMRGIDLEGNVVEREADELEARMYQHELDHLHGVLMFDRMTPEQRKEAIAEYRRLQQEAEQGAAGAAPRRRRLRLKGGWSTSARRRSRYRRWRHWSQPATTSHWWSQVSTSAAAAAMT